jgi:hypothetical protein
VTRSAIRSPPTLALAALLAAGAALRVALAIVQTPAMINQFDSVAYMWAADGQLFLSPWHAAGYPLYIWFLALFTAHPEPLIWSQHLLGLVTAWLLWSVVGRVTGNRWLGLVPAAFVALDADALLLEHSVMSETVFRFLVVVMLALVVRAFDADRPWALLALAGACCGAVIWVRFAGMVLLPVLGLTALVAFARPWHRRALAATAAVLVPALVLVGLYALLQGSQSGHRGLGQSGGWALYARAAGFADCREFSVPAGTEGLCQPGLRAEDRPPPDWYAWDPESPARQLFGGQPHGNELLREWATRAIVATPRQYVREVVEDLTWYVSPPPMTNSEDLLVGPFSVSFRLRSPDEHCDPGVCRPPPAWLEPHNTTGPAQWFSPWVPRTRAGYGFFIDYQRVFRTHGWLIVLLLAGTLAGAVAAIGRREARAQWLFAAAALGLLVFPVATATYNVRYALPVIPLLAVATVLGLRPAADRLAPAMRRARSGRTGAETAH